MIHYLGRKYFYLGDRNGCPIWKSNAVDNEFLVTECTGGMRAQTCVEALYPDRQVLSTLGGMETGCYTVHMRPVTDPTQLTCAIAPDGGSHHIVPTKDGITVCYYCLKTRSEIMGV